MEQTTAFVEKSVRNFALTAKAAAYILERWAKSYRSGDMSMAELASETIETLDGVCASSEQLRFALRLVSERMAA